MSAVFAWALLLAAVPASDGAGAWAPAGPGAVATVAVGRDGHRTPAGPAPVRGPPPGLGPHLARALRTRPGPVRALVRGAPPAALAALGVRVEATVGPISAVLVPDAAAADRIARAGAVLEHPAPLRPTLDVSRALIGADTTDYAEPPLRGAGVIIGAYDTGLDLTHPDFRDLDGRSRVVAAWDQDRELTCDEARLRADECPLGDPLGHGTHVSSIAAGSGPRFRGIAPAASLLMVRSALFERFVPALAFMSQIARGRGAPLVVNISLGGHVGAHDGTSLECQAIDAMGSLVVVAAGNEGNTPIHATTTLAAGTPADLAVLLEPSDTATHTRGIVDVWGAPTASIGAALLAVRGGRIVWSSSKITPGAAGRGEAIELDDGRRIGEVQLDADATVSALNGRPHLALELAAALPDDVVLALRLTGTGEVHAWLDAPADEPNLPRFAVQPALGLSTEALGDTAYTLSDLASAPRALAVSAMVSRVGNGAVTPRVGDLSGFSSRGPTLDPARTGAKPDLAAPGQSVIAAASRDLGDQLYRPLSGTSMAVPHVAGAAAVLLGFAPGATPDIVEEWLLGTAAAPSDADPRWGAGRLDLGAAARTAGATTAGCGCDAARARPHILVDLAAVAALAYARRRRAQHRRSA